MRHVISWSGGKDSTATVILMKQFENELLKPGDEVHINFVEPMFDLKRNISGMNPDVMRFIYEKKKVFESWGYTVNILRSDIDYLTWFHDTLKRSPTDPKRIGLTRGFPLPKRMCWVKREMKEKVQNQYNKSLKGIDHIEYVGMALDEPDRMESLLKEKPSAQSLLIRYGLTEDDARELCKEHDMLSPQYSMNRGKQKRDGCWFCPNAKLCEHKAIKEQLPDVWEQYISLEDIPDLAYKKWNPYSKHTLHDIDMLIDAEIRAEKFNKYKDLPMGQLSIFDFGIVA